MNIEDLTKMVFYLVGDFDADHRRKIIGDFLGEHLPCTTMLYVVALAAPIFKVEIDAWACKKLMIHFNGGVLFCLMHIGLP